MQHRRTLALVVSLALSACGIPTEEHQKTLDQLAKTQQELAAARASTDKLDKDMKALEEEKNKLGGELTNVSNTNVNLEQTLNKTSDELSATKAELEQLRKQREQAEKRMKTFRDLAMRLKSMVDAGKLQVQIRKGKMIVKLADNVLFSPGSATLKKQGQAPLSEVANALKEIGDRDFVIAGHSDNAAINTARFPSNWELSTQRAVEVVKFLATQGVNPAQLSASGYSEFDPVAPNEGVENKQLNRRIEIIVMPNIEELPKMDEPASAPAM